MYIFKHTYIYIERKGNKNNRHQGGTVQIKIRVKIGKEEPYKKRTLTRKRIRQQ